MIPSVRHQEGSAPRRRIVIVVPDYLPSLGGTTTQTRLHAAEFARRGWDVTVVTRRVSGDAPGEVDGIPVRRVGPAGRSRAAKAPMLAALWWWLVRRRRSISAVSVIMDADFTVCSWLAGLGRVTLHTWVTDGDASRALSGPEAALRSRSLRRSVQVVLSEPMREELVSLGLGGSVVIPVPVDSSRFRPPSPEERTGARSALGLGERTVVLSVSHLQERKGTDRLLAAVSLLGDHGVDLDLLLVGGPVESEDAAYVAQLQEFVSSKSLGRSVRFEGPRADVRPYLFAADIFCLASHREGMPNVLLEAMACGVPCIAPASAGGDVLLRGGVGSIASSNEPVALAAAIGELVDDAAMQDTMRRLALELVGRFHSIGAVIDHYEELIGGLRKAPWPPPKAATPSPSRVAGAPNGERP